MTNLARSCKELAISVQNQGEFEGVLPKDLRRRTETQTKFGAQFWCKIISNKIWRMILAQHLTT